jgi:hypothetical protein
MEASNDLKDSRREVRIMHMYETTTGRRQSGGYTGLFAIICLFASIFLAWAVMGAL